jgi:hypothetical protein
MFRAQKIPCYVLVFDQTEIIRQSLDFLTKYTDKLDIIVIENPSKSTPDIKRYVQKLGAQHLVRRYYLFDDNITGAAYELVLRKEQEFVGNQKFVILTDGDVTSTDTNWLSEETRIIRKHNDIFSCGVSLDKINLPIEAFPEATQWIPDDISVQRDFYEAYTGAHLLMFRGKELSDFLDWQKENQKNFVDGVMHAYSREQLGKKWARTKNAKAYHLTWDLYSDPNHPYTLLKTNKSFKDTWYHNKTSSYTLEAF